MDDQNPYAPPVLSLDDSTVPDRANRFAPSRLHLAWFAVFAFNLVLPLLFGWGLTSATARIGMLMAVMILLAAGYWICSIQRDLGRLLVFGGAFVGLSQIYPILQIVAGLGGMVVGQAFGQVSAGDQAAPAPLSQTGGFLVTLTTGGLLMMASLALGYAMQKVKPRQWWRNRRRCD